MAVALGLTAVAQRDSVVRKLAQTHIVAEAYRKQLADQAEAAKRVLRISRGNYHLA